ncbi:MAG: hypothetical protein M0Z28_05150 [Rhodospirillales bacterium]|nr:hypothetical protein [Rhodospirillales bacterium]
MPVRHSESLSGKVRPGASAAGTSPGDDVTQRIDEAVRGWVEQMERMRKGERDIGQRLMACATPAEAVAVSGEWMAHRIDSLMALQHRLIEMWLDQATISLTGKTARREDGDDGNA